MIAVVTIAILVSGYVHWKRGAPRRHALHTLSLLQLSLSNGQSDAALDLVLMPLALTSRTKAEQAEFLAKALNDEVSPEGLKALARDAAFGPLLTLFPDEGAAWAHQAGADPAKCLAFRAERDGLRAEVVLLVDTGACRVVRLNNVKQLTEDRR